MFYVLYKITNIINNHFYIGVHQTNNLNDRYFGSSKILKKSIKKYGKQNFIKEILYFFNNLTDMYLKEKEIVNEKLIKRNDVYNARLGGIGGNMFVKGTPEYEKHIKKTVKSMQKNQPSRKDKNSKEYKEWKIALLKADRNISRKFIVSKEQLQSMVNTMPITKVADFFKVSRPLIYRRIKELEIIVPIIDWERMSQTKL